MIFNQRRAERLPTSTPTKPGILQRWDNFSIEKLFARKKRTPTPRSVYLNSPLPYESTLGKKPWYEKMLQPKSMQNVGSEWIYTTNQIISSKYTVLTFVPRNLLEQFRRVANLFFLGIAILQFFPKFSTINGGVVILPLIIIVFITACKDGYEDIKRHQSDRKVNHSKVQILKGTHGAAHHSEYHYHNFNHVEAKSKTFTAGLPKNVKLGKLRLKKKSKTSDHLPPPTVPDAVTSLNDEAKFENDQGAYGISSPPELNDTRDFDGRQMGLVDDLENPRTYTPPPAPAQLPTGPIVEDDEEFGEEDDEEDEAGNKWKTSLWEDVKVGDFVKINNNEQFPADIVICSTSEEEDVCFVETKNLDGETNLKSRHAIPQLSHFRSPSTIARDCHGYRIDSEAADVNMFKLNAAVVKEGTHPTKSPVDMSTVLLRGTVLRNTKWVIGVVLFTGSDTKIIANSGITPSKRAKTERLMDPQVGINLALLAVMSAFCAIVAYTIEVSDQRNGAYWTIRDDRPGDNPSANGVFTFFNGLITFQNIVPISLYISMEFVRTCQAGWIYLDKDMRYKKNGYRAVARSWNLSDELGQIQYIFSDKTGTLTQNSMIFRQCSIAGKIYKSDDTTVVESKLTSSPQMPASIVGSETPLKTHSSSNSSDGYEARINEHTDGSQVDSEATVKPKFYSSALHTDIRAEGGGEEAEKRGQDVDAFLTCLSLCHTALASEQEDGSLDYKAQSPDESALVQGAADVGYVFKGRDRNILKLQTPFTNNNVDYYELLNVLEFSSARKRMSVVVRKLSQSRAQMKIDVANNVAQGERNPQIPLDDDDEEDSEIVLLTKGADNVIFERCEDNIQNRGMKDVTDKDLSYFASEGLRTLCLGYRVVPSEEYEEWNRKYNEATVALDNREQLLEEEASRFETNLTLLGATAIEDKLQDGVPETIRDLKRAGIKVWVATGDKLETAIAIGYSTQLLTNDNNLIIVRGGGYGERNSAYAQMRRAIDQFFPEERIPSRLRNQPPDNGYDNMKRSSTHSHALSGIESLVGADNGQRDGGYALVIDGMALSHALSEPWSKDLLLNLALKCKSVVCCRVSPLQKALVVRLIKDNLDTMTLAIGDGANDVSMIQAAHVGIGIAGEEGLQAVNSSDYAIAQFRYLKKLLLVHGHWCYYRNSNSILNFWFKNIIGVGVLFWYQFFCAYSTSYVFEYVYLLLWNVFWTLCPVIGIGLFDRDLNDKVLMAIPELYKYGRKGQYFNSWLFILYMFEGILQSTIVFFFTYYAYMSPTTRADGYDTYVYEMSTTMVIAAVTGCNLFSGLNVHAWTWWIVFGVFFGIVFIWAFTAVYSALSPQLVWTNLWGNEELVFHSALFWFCLIFTVIFSLMPRYVFKAYKFQFHPDDINIIQYVQKKDDDHDFENDPLMQSHLRNTYTKDNEYPPNRPSSVRSGQRIDMSTGQRSTGRNQTFGFDQEENGYAMQRLQSHLSETSSQFHRRPSANDAEIQSRRRKFKRKTNSWTSRTVESFKTALPRKSKNA
ncbi:phospholipid-translocating P-type ATPase [Wallemia mellicola]|uniref:Phospholipid-transporting ATPase n=1 Tax=Wallemia mellicola TaxID=1708541 RepID=A0AB74KG95_9BASI|nr:phospholipid-translocating P-type ATPase [Wallemia mellicola]